MSPPSRHSLTRFESDEARGRWWKRVRSTRISQMVRSRMPCEASRVSREPSCVLQEKLGYKVDSKSIVLPWLVRHPAYVLSRFVKRDDGRSGWARLRGKECDSPVAQVGETADFKIVRGEMAELEPRWATGTFLGHTDESDEVIVGTAVGVEFTRSFRKRTRVKQWQRDAFTTFTGVPWNPRGLAVEAPFNSTARRQAFELAWEFHCSTRQGAEKDSSGRPVQTRLM